MHDIASAIALAIRLFAYFTFGVGVLMVLALLAAALVVWWEGRPPNQ